MIESPLSAEPFKLMRDKFIPFDPASLTQLPFWSTRGWNPLKWGRIYWQLFRPYWFYWKRYDIWVYCKAGRYDGATAALDLKPEPNNPPHWLPHDAVCADPYAYKDNSFESTRIPITPQMAAELIYDVLLMNGHNWSAPVRKKATFWFGCKKTRQHT